MMHQGRLTLVTPFFILIQKTYHPFILGHGSVFVIVFWVGGGVEFDEFVVVILSVVKLLPDLFDCGEVFLVSGVGFIFLGKPLFPR
jgi:hypothetical protein